MIDAGLIENIRDFRNNQTELEATERQYFEKVNSNLSLKLRFAALGGGCVLSTDVGNYILPRFVPFTYFRGQWKDYGQLRASAYRVPLFEGVDSDIDLFIKRMRIMELKLLLKKTNRVNIWSSVSISYCDIYGSNLIEGIDTDYEAIAQHYGLETRLIDFTNDFDIALFFASTRFDPLLQKYRPLNEEDIKESPNGVIYYIPMGNMNEMDASDDYLSMIGIQPFMRSTIQSGFVYRDDGTTSFNSVYKFSYKHDLDLCKELFDKYDGGKAIFTEIGTEWLDEQVKMIFESNHFSESSFRSLCSEMGIYKKKRSEIKHILKECSISIGKSAYRISVDDISKIDRDWTFNSYLTALGYDKIEVIGEFVADDGEPVKRVKHHDERPLITLISQLYMMEHGRL